MAALDLRRALVYLGVHLILLQQLPVETPSISRGVLNLPVQGIDSMGRSGTLLNMAFPAPPAQI